MNYIDKIKKNGVIYEIRGKGTGSSSGTATNSSSTVLTYEPNENGYQLLDKSYGPGEVDTIIWKKFDEKAGAIEEIVCPQYYCSCMTENVTLYLASAFQKTADYCSMAEIICLIGGRILFNTYVEISWKDEGAEVLLADPEGTQLAMRNAITEEADAIVNKFSNYWKRDSGIDEPPLLLSTNTKGIEDDEAWEPNINDTLFVMAADTLSRINLPDCVSDSFVFFRENEWALSDILGLQPYVAPVK